MTYWTYESLKQAVEGRPLPLVLVDLERFDANVRYFAERALQAKKTIRIATKSIRVPALLRRALDVGGSSMQGLMCYNAREASFLATLGFDDLLVAYPTVDPADLEEIRAGAQVGKKMCLVVDCADHVKKLAAIWRSRAMPTRLRVCIDVDVSWRQIGLHIGVQRSPVRTAAEFEHLVDLILATSELKLSGLLAYDAQLAGVTDSSPFSPSQNIAVRILKWLSSPDVTQKRAEYRGVLRRKNLEIDFMNGAGTGSFEVGIRDPQLSEVTIGSGLLQSHLFDYYRGTERPPAFCFALAITRCPQVDRITCHGGGFVASGPPGPDRQPILFLPVGLKAEPRKALAKCKLR